MRVTEEAKKRKRDSDRARGKRVDSQTDFELTVTVCLYKRLQTDTELDLLLLKKK